MAFLSPVTSGSRSGAGVDIPFTLPIEATHVSLVAINAEARVVRIDEKPKAEGKRVRVATAIEKYSPMRPESAAF
jgi:hypothetical protein